MIVSKIILGPNPADAMLVDLLCLKRGTAQHVKTILVVNMPMSIRVLQRRSLVKTCQTLWQKFRAKKLQLSGGQNLSSTFQPKDIILEATFQRILTNPNQAWLFDTWSKYCMSVRIYLFHLSTEIWSSLISAVSVLDQTQVLPCPEKVVPCWVSSLIIWLCDTLTMITPKIKSKLWLMNVISIHLSLYSISNENVRGIYKLTTWYACPCIAASIYSKNKNLCVSHFRVNMVVWTNRQEFLAWFLSTKKSNAFNSSIVFTENNCFSLDC